MGLAAYRITARSLERQLVGDKVLREFATLDDVSRAAEPSPPAASKRVVLVLEDEEAPHAGAPRRPQ
jgi:hypothetical protein